MRTFNQYIEGIIDPKRNPKPTRNDLDDYYNGNDDDEDEEVEMPTRAAGLGLTAQYPLAKASGKLSGFQTKSPDEMFKNKSTMQDEKYLQDRVDTLRSKLYSGEKMSVKEIDYLIKHLNKEIEMLSKLH